jgi:hypothetical protein
MLLKYYTAIFYLKIHLGKTIRRADKSNNMHGFLDLLDE